MDSNSISGSDLTGAVGSVPISQPSKVDTDTMLAFYQRLFPFRYLFQWLNHGIVPSVDFGNREFALTLQNDAYLRYQSYATADLYVRGPKKHHIINFSTDSQNL